MTNSMLIRHPWIALLGFFPPVYLVGVIRTWNRPEYDVAVFEFFFLEVTGSACFWWPINLFNRLRCGIR